MLFHVTLMMVIMCTTKKKKKSDFIYFNFTGCNMTKAQLFTGYDDFLLALYTSFQFLL